MSAVRRWTWPMVVPAGIGRSARAIGSMPSSLMSRGWHPPPMLRYALLDRALNYHLLPDSALLLRSRAAARLRLRTELAGGVEAQEDRLRSLVWQLSHGPITEGRTDGTNDLPAEFFTLFLGPRHKYSCALWTPQARALAQAEEAMLALTCERAQIEDGME